jgi:hypothetical protein
MTSVTPVRPEIPRAHYFCLTRDKSPRANPFLRMILEHQRVLVYRGKNLIAQHTVFENRFRFLEAGFTKFEVTLCTGVGGLEVISFDLPSVECVAVWQPAVALPLVFQKVLFFGQPVLMKSACTHDFSL